MLFRLGIKRSCLVSCLTPIVRSGPSRSECIRFVFVHRRQASLFQPLSKTASELRLKPSKKILALVTSTACGFVWYFTREEQTSLNDVLASSNLIPCTGNSFVELQNQESQTLILSPDEEDLSLVRKLSQFWEDYFWEPLLTARRFVHLFIIFMPVLLSSPMVLIGHPEARYRGDKWGAVWWYGQLVSAMERAGPTFIKVIYICLLLNKVSIADKKIIENSLVNGRRLVPIYFLGSYVIV